MKSILSKILFLLIMPMLFSGVIGYYINWYQNEDLQKYRPLEDILEQISKHPSNWDTYNCLNFSQDGQKALQLQGINSSIIVGSNGTKYDHAYLGIWIDPQTTNFVQGYKFKNVYDK